MLPCEHPWPPCVQLHIIHVCYLCNCVSADSFAAQEVATRLRIANARLVVTQASF